jgi:membrane fusion protein (multidrug efflux system)
MKKMLWAHAALTAAIISSCTSGNGNEDLHDKNQVLPVTTLITRRTALHRDYVGDLNAFQNVEIRARVQGYLEKINVDEGKTVKKGQSLFTLSDEEYEAELSKTKASLKTAIAETKAAELELNRVHTLVEKGVVSHTELEVAQANYEAVKAGIERARSAQANAATHLSYTHIKSPFDGIIDRIPYKVGSLINEGTLLTTVSDVKSITAYFNVSEIDYLEYIKNSLENPGEDKSQVQLILADGSFYPYKGKIETMDGEFEENTGTIAFRARFPNPDKLLKHGSTGTIRITNQINNALIVPQKSTFEIQDKNYVFVVDDKNMVSMKSFVPKIRFSDYYIVESGLMPGEKVVYEGVQKVKDGMKIVPQYVMIDSLKSFTTLNQFLNKD